MGVVYKALQPRLNRWVAIKIIRTEESPGPEAMARFRLEAEAIAQMQHPNIVQVFLAGEDDGRPYLVLEYVDGGTLVKWAGDSPRTQNEAAEMVATLASAVHHAHRRGIVHRDLKPSNVLLTAEGVPKVSDFGLALANGDVENRPGQSGACGTVGYMPPEQAWGSNRLREVGPAADVYALGVMLYELIAGRRPFRGASDQETLRLANTQQEPPPLRNERPDVSRDLEAICRKCLLREPHDRYADAGALHDDLVRYLRGKPTDARPVGKPVKAWMWCMRNPLAAVLLSLVSAAVVLASGVATVAIRQRVLLADARAENALAEQAKSDARAAKAVADLAREQAEADARAAKAQAEENAYFNIISLADRELKAGRMAQAEQLLESYHAEARQKDRRGFEWYHLQRRLHAETMRIQLTSRGPYPWNAQELAFTADDRRLCLAPRLTVPIPGPPARAQAQITVDRPEPPEDFVAFSHDGALVATASVNRPEIVIRSTTDGTLTHRLAGHPRVAGERFGSGPEEQNPIPYLFSLCFGPRGRRMASIGHDEFIRVWDADEGREVARLSLHTTSESVVGGSVTLSPDGGAVAAVVLRGARKAFAGKRRPYLMIWDVTKDHPRFEPMALSEGRLIASAEGKIVAFSSDGKWVAAAMPWSQVSLHHALTGEVARQFGAHRAVVASIAFSPDGGRMATAGWDRLVSIWDLRPTDGGPPMPHLRGSFYAHGGTAGALAFSNNGQTLATQSGSEIKVWDIDWGQGLFERSVHAGGVLALSTEGTLLATGGADGRVALWSLPGLEPRGELAEGAAVTGLSLRPGGGLLAVSSGPRMDPGWVDSDNGELHLWDIGGQTPHRSPLVAPERVLWFAFNPNGESIAACEPGKFVFRDLQFWDLKTGNAMRINSPGAGGSFTFRPDGRELVVTDSSDAVFLDARNGRELRTEVDVREIAFSPDGRLAARLDKHGRVTISDSRTGARQAEWSLPLSWEVLMKFSPDGSRLATRGWDQAVIGSGLLTLWDTRTGREAITLSDNAAGLNDFAFSPDGTLLISTWKDGSLRVWDATPLPAVAR
jgi:WD40 repeat protein